VEMLHCRDRVEVGEEEEEEEEEERSAYTVPYNSWYSTVV
jgi:hypothetical protein